MRIFAIKNEAKDKRIEAYLFYYEKKDKFFVELLDDSDFFNTPLLLSSFAKRNIKTVNSYASRLWVEQRIIPRERQNIAQILKENKLKDYDVFTMLLLNKGRCCQDECFLSEIEFIDLPISIQNRFKKRIDDICYIKEDKYLIFFKNGEIKICELNNLIKSNDRLNKFLNLYPEQISKARIEAGGHGLCFSSDINITSEQIYLESKNKNITSEDIYTYISNRLINTSEACELLNCSRQNIEYLISQNKLKPIIVNEKSKHFLRKDIEEMIPD